MQAQALAWQAPLVLMFSAGPNAALLTVPDVALWLADADAEIVFAAEIHETLGTDGSAVTADIVKVADGTALASGTSLLATTFNLKATVATRQTRQPKAGPATSGRVIFNCQTPGLHLA